MEQLFMRVVVNGGESVTLRACFFSKRPWEPYQGAWHHEPCEIPRHWKNTPTHAHTHTHTRYKNNLPGPQT